MPKFLIPVAFEMWGVMQIEAPSLKEAEEIALTTEPLPREKHYVDDSIMLDRDAIGFGKAIEINSFLDFLRSGVEIDCYLIIGNVDMPASFVWNEDSKITDFGIEKYKPIMEAEYTMLKNGNIEIHCEDCKLGEDFCLAAAGYIDDAEYKKIFGAEEIQEVDETC